MKFLQFEFGINVIFERSNETIDKIYHEINKYKKFLISNYDILKNDLANSLVKKYLKYYSKNIYNQYKVNAYSKLYIFFKNNYLHFYKNNILIEDVLNKIPFGRDKIKYIVLNFKDEKTIQNNGNLYPRIPYIKEKNFNKLKAKKIFTLVDIINNLSTIIHIVEPHVIKYLTFLSEETPVKKVDLNDFVLKIKNKNIVPVGSFNTSKDTSQISDLDLLILDKELVNFFDKLKSIGEIKTMIKNGPRIKQIGYCFESKNFIIDLFITTEITQEKIILYSISKIENINLRKMAKQKNLKLNFEGLWNGNIQIHFKTKQELLNMLN